MKQNVLTIKAIVNVKGSKTGSRRIYFEDSRSFYETRPTALVRSLQPGNKVIFNKNKHTLKPAK